MPCAFTHRDTPAGRFAGAAAVTGAGTDAAAESSAMTDRSASRNRSAGGRPPQDWCGRAVLYSHTQPSSAACSSSTAANVPSLGVKNSARIVLCSRSTFPVVVGEYGAVSRCRMPLSAQIRSNSTSAGRGLVKRPVNCLPLSS